jgi:hypothetical protein
MSHPVWYTRRMIIKTDMKNEMKNNKASNLILGAIYINATTGQPCRLVNIVSCQGVWLEAYDGEGYGDLVKFEDCQYADIDEVTDYLEDYHAYHTVDGYKPERDTFMGDERQVDVNGDVYIREEEDYLCRD